MQDRFKFRIPMFTDKGNFQEFQYLELGEQEECTLCGYNGEPQQCTGLKDKNGKLIYEGDIVKHSKSNQQYKVQWNNKGFWQLDDYAMARSAKFLEENYEVIGNIYENPELLEDNQ